MSVLRFLAIGVFGLVAVLTGFCGFWTIGVVMSGWALSHFRDGQFFRDGAGILYVLIIYALPCFAIAVPSAYAAMRLWQRRSGRQGR